MADKSIRPVAGARNDSIRSDFFVYIHTRNDTGEVFYVGKGRGRRLRTKRHHNRYWMRVAEKHGFTVHLQHSDLSEACAFTLEKILIAKHRAIGSPLVNMTVGGEGPAGRVFSAETLEKMRAAKLGKSLPREHANNISKALSGRKWTEEQKAGLRGRKLTEQQRLALSKSQTGKRHSEETKRKISIAKRGQKPSEETLRKRRIALGGVRNPHFSPERHSFVHPEHGVRVCTQYELRTEFGLPHSNLSRLVSGKRSVVHGWRLLKPGG